jgi:hypothetical protein
MSRNLPRVCLALAIAFAALSSGLREAAACSCVRPENASTLTEDELLSWRFDRARIVVSGVVTDFRAGEDAIREGRRVVVASLKVNSVLKGDATIGKMSLVTGFGGGDCGLSGPLFLSSSGGWDLAVEVQKIPGPGNDYSVTSCGYSKLSVRNQ